MDEDGAIDVARRKRTAKSCGPDVRGAGIKSQEKPGFSGTTVAKKPFAGESTYKP
jgi:hypothetical protein